MNKLFDYIYFRTFMFYLLKRRETAPHIYANSVVVLLKGSLLLSVFCIFKLLTNIIVVKSKYIYAAIMLCLYVLNSIRYFNKKRFVEFEKKWKNEDIRKKKANGVAIVFFIILTFVITVFLLDYTGKSQR